MKLRSAVFLAVLLGLLPSASREAQAQPPITVDVVWTSTTGAGTTGGSSIDAAPGDQLVAEIRIIADAGGVAGYAISLEFDTDFGNELDLVSATKFTPTGLPINLMGTGLASTQESTGGQKGNVLTYEAVADPRYAGPTGIFVAGEVTFNVTGNVTSDGDDVFSGTFNAEADGVINNANAIVNPVFRNAAVNQIAGAAVPVLSAPLLVVLLLLILLGPLWVIRRDRGARA